MPGPVTLPYVFATMPTGNVPAADLDDNFNALNTGLTAPLQSYLAGFQMSNDATTPNSVLDITPGLAADSTNANYIQTAATFYGSTGGSWVAGAGTSGSPVNKMGVGLTIANSTWYHVFAIINAGAADVYFDTSATAANAPSGTTAFRRIGSFKTDGSAHILAFSQNGDEFLWRTPQQVLNDNSSFPTVLTGLPMGTPTGVKTNVLFSASVAASNQNFITFLSPDTNGSWGGGSGAQMTFATNNGSSVYSSVVMNLRTDTSGLINWISSGAGTSPTRIVWTSGWIDTRGRNN